MNDIGPHLGHEIHADDLSEFDGSGAHYSRRRVLASVGAAGAALAAATMPVGRTTTAQVSTPEGSPKTA